MENMGIEPMTSCKLAEVMLSKRSTPELIPHCYKIEIMLCYKNISLL